MKVLIVEDEAGIVNFLSRGLAEEGYGVMVACNGHEGLVMASEERPDIILLDWMLPGLSGIEVCKSLRGQRIEIPIIFLTAKDTMQETIAGLDSGANDYIKKPFRFEELLARINVQLRSRSDAKDEIFLGQVRIALSPRKVFKGRKEINLTSREFELLAYLAERKNRVCTREQIIKDVWDIHFDYDTGVIDVFINAIRKKLDLHKEEDFIKTVRGIGYMAEF
ncbi:MAG: DNA-binding response regulator [Flavobacterium psychrophilum]|nr:MAG: DNA-binding response regulator [Flavobacterium psychrophilum]